MSLARWFRTVMKDMTQVAVAPGADDFGAIHTVAPIGFASDSIADGFGKARPPTS